MPRLYRLLLRLWPEGTREGFAEEMADTFEARLDHVRRTRGSLAAGVLALRSCATVVWTAVLEHRDAAGAASHDTRTWGERMTMGMGKWWADLKHAVRQLLRSPGFTVVAVASLALGIGANSAIFSIVNAVFLRPLPVHDPATLYEVYTHDASNAALGLILVSIPNYEDLAEASSSFERLSAFTPFGVTYSVDDADPDQTAGMMVTGDYFATLGVDPHLGRLISPGDDAVRGASAVAVVSHSLWLRVLGAEPDAVGRTMTLNGFPFTVVGVTPPDFRGTQSLSQRDRIWIPLAMRDAILTGPTREIFDMRRALPLTVLGRLAPGATAERAQAELTSIAARLESAYPEDNHDRTFSMVPLVESAVGVNQRDGLARSGMLLMSVVGLVLMIACANLANLLLARSAARARELSVRASLGARRWDLVRQMLVESLVLAVVGGGLGLVVAGAGSSLLLRFRPQFIPADAIEASLDARVMAFTAVAAIVTGVLFGLLPAVRASSPDLIGILKESSRGGGTSRSALRSGLVVAEVALAIVGLMGAGLFIRSMQEASDIEPGWVTDGMFIMAINPTSAGYSQDESIRFVEEALERVRTVPGVEHASFAAHFPLSPPAARTFRPESPEVPLERPTFIGRMPVTTGYFETLGMQLVDGRWLTDEEYLADGPHSALVNEATVRQYWPNSQPLGQRFSFFNDPRVFEIVGVVEDVALSGLEGPTDAAVYFPYSRTALPFAVLHARTSGDAAQVMAAVQTELGAIDRSVAVQGASTAEDILSQTLWPRRMGAALLSIFAALALVMAAAGIHAVMSYTSALRRHEIGVRMALGAEAGGVLWMVLRQGMALVALGAVVGLGAAMAGGSLVADMLYGVDLADPLTLVLVPAVLAAVAFVACGIPAWRSTRVHPVQALQPDSR